MHNILLKKLKVASCAIAMASAANQAAAQANTKTAICEVRPGCQVIQGYMPSGFNEPFCEEIYRDTQFIGGQCQGGVLSGVVQEVIWVDGRPYYKFFRIYENGVNSQPNGDYFVKHERGRLIIERIGFGTVHDCGAIGAFSPWPGSESECQKTRQAYGESAFSKQPSLKRDRFKVKTVSVIQGDITRPEINAADPRRSYSKTPENIAAIDPTKPGYKMPGAIPAIDPTKKNANSGGVLNNEDCLSAITRIHLEAGTRMSSARTPIESANIQLEVQAIPQKKLFEGRCSSHPQAAAYVASANRLISEAEQKLGSSVRGANRVNSSNMANSLSNSETDSIPEPSDSQPVMDCVVVSRPEGDNWASMYNKCTFYITVDWCYVGAECGAAGGGNLGNIAPKQTRKASTLIGEARKYELRYSACSGRDKTIVRDGPQRYFCK